MYAKFSEKLTFLTPDMVNVNFSENFAYVLNGKPVQIQQQTNLKNDNGQVLTLNSKLQHIQSHQREQSFVQSSNIKLCVSAKI